MLVGAALVVGSFAEVSIVEALGSDLIAAGADLSSISETLDAL